MPNEDKEEANTKEGAVTNYSYENNGTTITVHSNKVIGEYNYSFVSVSPT